MKKLLFILPILLSLFLFFESCNKDIEHPNKIKSIKIARYSYYTLSTPFLFLTTIPTNPDTNLWLINIVVPDSVLNQVRQRGYDLYEKTDFKNVNLKKGLYVEFEFCNTKMKTEGYIYPLPNIFLNLVSKTLKENDINDLDIALKKINYMKD